MASVSSSLRQQATAVVNQQLLSLCRWQKLCQLLLSISQVSLISQHLTLHLNVEQSPCKNKIKTIPFVAKEHLGCTIAIYFPTQNATSFPEMKNVMWPAAGADEVKDHAKQRERRVTTNFCFVWLAQAVALWLPGLRALSQGLSSCTHPVFYWSPAWHQSRSCEASQEAKQVTFVIPAHRTGHGSFLWHPCDSTEPWRWQMSPKPLQGSFSMAANTEQGNRHPVLGV